jgi:hypothetical protein
MKKLVVLVTQEDLGRVDPANHQFGVEMFDRFLHAVESQAVRPACICFYTNGVKLVCEGSPAGAFVLGTTSCPRARKASV